MRILIGVIFSILISFRPFIVFSDERLLVDMILVSGARKVGAVCLDGSLPGYHLHRGSGAGARNWLLQFEGGGWCNDIRSCLERSNTNHGSTRYMRQYEVFSGILSNNASFNPDFYNWNRVKLRYCDGASFSGDSEFLSDTTVLYFRGKRIWDAIILDLLPRGLNSSEKVLLSGCSAGGLATFLHCDNLTRILPSTTTVKCLCDAGFFLDIKDVLGNRTIRTFFDDLVSLQGVRKNLDKSCTATDYFEAQCFFPQHALPFIKTPYFLLNSAYDVFQFHHIIVPPSADPYGRWQQCKLDSDKCNPFEMNILQGFRTNMLEAMSISLSSRKGGMYINSCFAHCQSEFQDTWFASNSPRIHNKTIAEAVGDWYFERNTITKEIDCPYPCDRSCHNLI